MDGIRRLISIPFWNLLIDRDRIILGPSNFIKRLPVAGEMARKYPIWARSSVEPVSSANEQMRLGQIWTLLSRAWDLIIWMEQKMLATLRLAALTLSLAIFACDLAAAQNQPPPPPPRGSTFSTGDIVREGHRFFGTVSRGLAQIVETAVSRWGQPNGYILGQEGSGAFVVGLRYGDGKL
jgi:hypothetical protein